jgi:glycosyltransferase involved in cell wall biosynthesis
MFISSGANNKINIISDTNMEVVGQSVQEIDSIGHNQGKQVMHKSEMKIAIVCNWLTKCGISTYSKYFVDEMKNHVKEVKIFSEVSENIIGEDDNSVDRCWSRGTSLLGLAKKIIDYKPDFIIIQHEFGIFPNMFYFMQLIQKINHIPYVVVLHSVYEHLDKLVYSNGIKNIIVHSESAKNILIKNGHNSNIGVVPHGCIQLEDTSELWNICHNPYTILQFGFGFEYKGVEKVLDAISYLKTNNPKFSNIFYTYLLSANEHTQRSHDNYYNKLIQKIEDLNIEQNVVILQKYQTDAMLNLYLRLTKLAVFPYINNPNNTVYAASGAVRIAMANKTPTIVSDSHLFDDLEGILPRPVTYIDLANEIDQIFSDAKYKNNILEKADEFVKNNSWTKSVDMYLNFYLSC